jgi:hypothetical protein
MRFDQLPEHVQREVYLRKAEMEQRDRHERLMRSILSLRKYHWAVPDINVMRRFIIFGGVPLRRTLFGELLEDDITNPTVVIRYPPRHYSLHCHVPLRLLNHP